MTESSTLIGRLLSRLYSRRQAPTVHILGIDSSGKTTLLYHLHLGQVVATIPTMGFNVETVKVRTERGRTATLCLWDTGLGCSRNYGLIRHYTEYIQAAIWVVDSTDRERIPESLQMMRDALPDRPVPMLIFANKQDQPGAMSPAEVHDLFSPSCRGRAFAVYGISAIGDISQGGVPQGLDWLLDALAKPVKAESAPMPVQSTQNPFVGRLEEWLERAEKDTTPEEFLEQFNAINLPAWDHYTHIRMAYVILTMYGRQKGKNMIFDGIERYIKESSQTRGRTFHVSMTYFWIQLVHFGIQSMPPLPTDDKSQAETEKDDQASKDSFARFLLVNPYLADGNLWADYYSKEVLMSGEARASMVLPDKKPLPNLIARDAPVKRQGNQLQR